MTGFERRLATLEERLEKAIEAGHATNLSLGALIREVKTIMARVEALEQKVNE